MVRPKGFEPLAFCSGGRRSIQLSYGRNELALYTFDRLPDTPGSGKMTDVPGFVPGYWEPCARSLAGVCYADAGVPTDDTGNRDCLLPPAQCIRLRRLQLTARC